MHRTIRPLGLMPALPLLVAAIFVIVGCSSPAERANEYYKNGMVLLETGEFEKARIEFQNALQLVNTKSDAVFGLALIAERQNDWEGMFRLLNRVVDLDPKHRQAHVSLGHLWLAAGNLDGALKSCNTALELAAEDPDALSLKAAILYKRGDAAGAIAQARAVLAKFPGNVEALVVLASERMTAGDTKGAIAYLDVGLAADNKNVPLQLIKIQVLEAGGKIADAEAVFQDLITSVEAKQRPGLRQSLAQFYLRHEKFPQAEAQLRAIAAEDGSNLLAKLAVVRFVRGARGDEAAISELLAFIEQDPKNYELRFALADLHRYRKDHASMKVILDDIAENAGLKDALKAKGLLAGSMLEHGDREGAAKLVSEILKEDPKQEEAVLLKAGVAIDERRIDPAIADLRILLREVPDSARAHRLLGNAHELAGSMELAEGEYLRAFQTSKQAESYGLSYAEFLNRHGGAARAGQVLEEMLRHTPASLPALQMLAKIRITQGDWAGAQAVADTIARLGDRNHISEQIRGTVYAQMHNYDASISAFRNALAAAPDESRPMIALVRAYVAAGKKKDAMKFIESILDSNPENILALQLKGQLLLLDEDVSGAQKALAQALAVAPDKDEVYRNLAAFYAREKRYDEAAAIIEQGLKQLPDNFNLQLSLAGIHEVSGRPDAAIELYERMLPRHPGADILFNNLAALLTDYRDDQASVKRAYELVKRLEHSDIPQYADTWAWASYRAGFPAQAVPALERVSRQMPESAVFRYHLGMVYRAQGESQKARAQLEQAIKLADKTPFPQLDRARAALAEL